jgi:hypothetical protein
MDVIPVVKESSEDWLSTSVSETGAANEKETADQF